MFLKSRYLGQQILNSLIDVLYKILAATEMSTESSTNSVIKSEPEPEPKSESDIASDIEKELLDSILLRYEPENRKSDADETSEMIKELERLTLELSLTIEEKKINDYFDKQYRLYLIEQMIVSPLLSTRIQEIIDLVKNDQIKILTDAELSTLGLLELSDIFMPQKESDFIISIESKSFLDSILETYESD